MNYKEAYKFWLQDDYFDESTKQELRSISRDEAEIEDRFYKELDFGTGGLRGIMGAGTNRLNVYTIRKTTQGLANYIVRCGQADKGVVIAYDSRNHSAEFAEEAALCLAANGIKAYLFEQLRPTPELSFAVRRLGAVAGIVVTASHNPPEYNGYKVYWEDGGQVTSPRDKEIIAQVNALTDYDGVKTMPRAEALQKKLLCMIGSDIDDAYMEELKKQRIHPEIIEEMGKELKIVYTPLHGSGNIPVRRILKELGFSNVYVVKEQEAPDGNFPTVAYPNPEDPQAFALALTLAKEVGADLILATDPDADRLGIYALNQDSGEYIAFTGNMSGVMIAEYILRERSKQGSLPPNPALVKTIVTTNMVDRLAEKYHVDKKEVLTGFKYIGEQIHMFEETGSNHFVFGMEESYGCLAGTHARDKDAVVAAMCLCEAAAFYKKQGMTLWDQMKRLYEEYGYFKEGLYTVTRKGVAGAVQIAAAMTDLRENPFDKLNGWKVLRRMDIAADILVDLTNGTVTTTGLPESDVLYFELEEDAWCCARPSGTEPKIKFYIGVKGNSLTDADQRLTKLTRELLDYIQE